MRAKTGLVSGHQHLLEKKEREGGEKGEGESLGRFGVQLRLFQIRGPLGGMQQRITQSLTWRGSQCGSEK